MRWKKVNLFFLVNFSLSFSVLNIYFSHASLFFSSSYVGFVYFVESRVHVSLAIETKSESDFVIGSLKIHIVLFYGEREKLPRVRWDLFGMRIDYADNKTKQTKSKARAVGTRWKRGLVPVRHFYPEKKNTENSWAHFYFIPSTQFNSFCWSHTAATQSCKKQLNPF